MSQDQAHLLVSQFLDVLLYEAVAIEGVGVDLRGGYLGESSEVVDDVGVDRRENGAHGEVYLDAQSCILLIALIHPYQLVDPYLPQRSLGLGAGYNHVPDFDDSFL